MGDAVFPDAATTDPLMNTSLAEFLDIHAEHHRDDDQYKGTAFRVHFVMNAFIGPIICILGVVGNILSITTWSRPGMTSSTGRYLTGQAIADLGVLVMFLLCKSLQDWAPSVKYSQAYGGFFSYLGYPGFYFAVVCSIWITVGVTVDRYIKVCWISVSKKCCSVARANFGLLLIVVNAFIINLPHYGFYEVVYPDDIHNDTIHEMSKTKRAFQKTEFGSGAGGHFYHFWVHCIVLLLVPWFSVLSMNVLIIRKIIRSNHKMASKMSRGSLIKCKDSENQITRLLLTVTFSFLFFIGLLCIVQCLWKHKMSGVDLVLVCSFYAFAQIGIILNSSLNFVLYCLTGRRFRTELKKLLWKNDVHMSSIADQSISGTSSSSSSSSSSSNSSSTGNTKLLSETKKFSL